MNCPKCGDEVETPYPYQVTAWRRLSCPNCKAGLSQDSPRAPFLMALIIMVSVGFVPATRLLGRQPGLFWIGLGLGIFFAALVAVTIFWMWELRHPKLMVRRKRSPEIVLNLNLKSSENIKNLR